MENKTIYSILEIIMWMLPIIIGIGLLYYSMKKYLLNKKVRETDTKIKAEITEIKDRQIEYTDSDGETYYKTIYDCTYTYNVNGESYSGMYSSNSRKKVGDMVSIYYNSVRPKKNETAANHNHYLIIFIVELIIFILICVTIY